MSGTWNGLCLRCGICAMPLSFSVCRADSGYAPAAILFCLVTGSRPRIESLRPIVLQDACKKPQDWDLSVPPHYRSEKDHLVAVLPRTQASNDLQAFGP